MRQITDEFLLNMAGISATLIGLFLVGVFFYMESGLRRLPIGREVFTPYLRAGIRITMIVFAMSLGLALALVALKLSWATVLFVLLSLMLLAANYDTAVRIWPVWKVTGSLSLLAMEVVTSLLVLTLVVLPWLLGGVSPSREDLTWAVLLSFAAGFLSITATVLSAFDLSGSGNGETTPVEQMGL